MKNVEKSSTQGCARNLRHGLIRKLGVIAAGASFLLSPLCPTSAMAESSSVTHLQYLQWMVQLTGENSQFNASSTPGDYIQWARSKGMSPSGGWQLGSTLTKSQLAQTLVQLYNLNPSKFGGDYVRILTREGIDLSAVDLEVTRQQLVSVLDDPNFQTPLLAVVASPIHGHRGIDPQPTLGNEPANAHHHHTP